MPVERFDVNRTSGTYGVLGEFAAGGFLVGRRRCSQPISGDEEFCADGLLLVDIIICLAVFFVRVSCDR